MTQQEVCGLLPALKSFLRDFAICFAYQPSRDHLQTYCCGLLADLPRKSVEPIALQAGTAPRTLQQFLRSFAWDHQNLRDILQRRIVQRHLPPPGDTPFGSLGVIGLIDETAVAKKGDQTPGVQRQYCGRTGKIDNCIVTVHLAVLYESFKAILDGELYLPQDSWAADRDRCHAAQIPQTLVYTPKHLMALEQVRRAMGNGVRFDWLTFDEGYGGKPGFLRGLDGLGLLYVGEVPRTLGVWSKLPKYHSHQSPFAAKRAEELARHSPVFREQPFKRLEIARQTLASQVWQVKAARVHISVEGIPTSPRYWLIYARNEATGEKKYFVSNAPEGTRLGRMLRVAFCRAHVEHVFRISKSELGFGDYEGRSYVGLMRHVYMCQLMLLFVMEQTERLRKKKSGVDAGANSACPEVLLSETAEP